MTRLGFFFRTAWSNLLHGGQRMVVAVLCIAFGTMSLLSMTLLSDALERMIVHAPQDLIGADISMVRAVEEVVLPEHVTQLDALLEEGLLDSYTTVAYTSSLVFHLPGSGELHFTGAGIGIDLGVYPPAGKLTIEGLESTGLPTLLQETGDVLVTRDLALEYNLAAGDRLVITDLAVGAPIDVRIRGIVIDTPNHQGNKLYYNLSTAEKLAAGGHSLNTVLALASYPAQAQTRLSELGWNAFTATQMAAPEEQAQDMFSLLLNGAGVLGLLVSGVGIANTMQVLMRRRRREVAIWKSIGYQSGDLLVLFALEATLLGLIGSLLGAVIGVAVSAGLVDLFSRTSTLLIDWVVMPAPLLLAVLVGMVTTVVFALWAIVTSSRVSPVALLRDEPASTASLPWFQAAALALALALPFTAVVSLIMGSALKGTGVLLFALAGLVGLGSVLGGLLWLFLRLLPLRAAPLLNMARGNLRRRGLSPVFALIALFVGVVALTTAGVVTQNAKRVMTEKAPPLEGDNLVVLAPAAEAGPVNQAITDFSAESMTLGYHTRVRAVRLAEDRQEDFTPLLMARSAPGEFTITGAPWGSRPDGVYVSELLDIPSGAALEVTLWDGSTRLLPVVGVYQVDFRNMFLPELGVLLPVELSRSITEPDQVQFHTRMPPERLSSSAQALGTALPQATVINMLAYATRFTSQYHNLFVFAISMASLALLAGALLMANSVSLAMLDRRYEIGVLKAIGYSRVHVLITLMVEYAMISLVACGAGLVVVRIFLWLVGLQNPLAGNLLVMTPLAAGAVVLVTLALTLSTVLAVTWKPTRVSPLVVLNDRG